MPNLNLGRTCKRGFSFLSNFRRLQFRSSPKMLKRRKKNLKKFSRGVKERKMSCNGFKSVEKVSKYFSPEKLKARNFDD